MFYAKETFGVINCSEEFLKSTFGIEGDITDLNTGVSNSSEIVYANLAKASASEESDGSSMGIFAARA